MPSLTLCFTNRNYSRGKNRSIFPSLAGAFSPVSTVVISGINVTWFINLPLADQPDTRETPRSSEGGVCKTTAAPPLACVLSLKPKLGINFNHN